MHVAGDLVVVGIQVHSSALVILCRRSARIRGERECHTQLRCARLGLRSNVVLHSVAVPFF